MQRFLALMLVSNGIFVPTIDKVPLATASAIGFTSPLIVTALSVPLRQQVGWRRWSAVFVGFAGALLIIGPGEAPPSGGAVAAGVVRRRRALPDRDALGDGA